MEIEGTTAHVTGAGAGIGRAIALRLAVEGAAVVVSDVDEMGGRKTVERIETAGGRATFVRADVSAEEDVRAMIDFTEELYGGLDVLVNNAGGSPEPYFPDADPTHWIRTVEVNLLGVMLGTHYGIAAMKRGRGGAILNVASSAGIGFRPYLGPEYAASKAGVWRFSASLGSLAEGHGIRVNCISPDWVEVEAMRAARLEMGDEEWAKVGPTELVQPEAIADVAVELIRRDDLAGRVMLCPCGGEWGLVPVDAELSVVPLDR